MNIHLAARSGEHIGISPLINKGIQPRKDSTVSGITGSKPEQVRF